MTPRARLEVARALVAARAPAEVDLGSWVGDCGTVACAVGWACRSPTIQAEGLTLDETGSPSFQGQGAFGAVAAFFGLSVIEAWAVFSPLPDDEVIWLWDDDDEARARTLEALARLRSDEDGGGDRATVLARMDRALARA
jgi:hypothetical protein